MNSDIDHIDKKILDCVAREGRISITDLAKRVNLSQTPTLQRLKRLQTRGYILGYKAILNLGKLGREHIAFIEVKLKDTSEPALAAFNVAVSKVAEVEQCHMIAGAFDYLLKVRTHNITAYRRVLGESISQLPYVANTSTYVSMQSVIDS